jgi:BstXI restriction endonuclease
MPARTNGYSNGLPPPIVSKIYKTGQTRGADKDSIYQNRVVRNRTVLIPYRRWDAGALVPSAGFENGYIVLISPFDYFELCPTNDGSIGDELRLGENLLVHYYSRREWDTHPPSRYGWEPATSRVAPLGGQYIARVADTTRDGDVEIRLGFTSRAEGQGAGIRVFEYASGEQIMRTRLQLAYLAWRSLDIEPYCAEFAISEPSRHKAALDELCEAEGLGDLSRLRAVRALNDDDVAICPLCRGPIAARDLGTRAKQAEGREVADLTITAANLFHIRELRVGDFFAHCEYNLAWGHHHCNTVARDWGLDPTLAWMRDVLQNNGYTVERPT